VTNHEPAVRSIELVWLPTKTEPVTLTAVGARFSSPKPHFALLSMTVIEYRPACRLVVSPVS
jgi:hypothetical protein